MFEKTTENLINFIQKSPSCYHVAENFVLMLQEHNFRKLSEFQPWKLEEGGQYFVVRGDSSLIAFKIPKKDFNNFQIIASHSDSPSFKIKEKEELSVDGHYIELNTEKYGGMLCAPWFDRPLSVAGKAVVRCSNTFETRLVNIDRDLVMMPNVAIHMNRQANDGYVYHAQKDMIPLFGDETAKGMFRKMIAKQIDAKEEDYLKSETLSDIEKNDKIEKEANEKNSSVIQADSERMEECSKADIDNNFKDGIDFDDYFKDDFNDDFIDDIDFGNDLKNNLDDINNNLKEHNH